MKKKKGFWALNIGLLYILPWLVGFLLFKVYPFMSSLYYSFTNYDLFKGISKVGLMNYEKIFTDEDIIRAFVVTFKYAILDVYKRQAPAPCKVQWRYQHRPLRSQLHELDCGHWLQ